MSGSSGKGRALAWVLFIIYIALIIYLMFFSAVLDRDIVSGEFRSNLTLFKEIKRFWNMHYQYGWGVTLANIGGNIICFIPFGALVRKLFSRKKRPGIITITGLSFIFSLFLEVVQLATKVGAFDVDDLLLNTIGGFIGGVIIVAEEYITGRRKKRRSGK